LAVETPAEVQQANTSTLRKKEATPQNANTKGQFQTAPTTFLYQQQENQELIYTSIYSATTKAASHLQCQARNAMHNWKLTTSGLDKIVVSTLHVPNQVLLMHAATVIVRT
jgi:hypothetical protein